MKNYLVPEHFIFALERYLSQKPWAEVNEAMVMLHQIKESNREDDPKKE